MIGPSTPPPAWRKGAWILGLATAVFFLASRLPFGPVPWPDASAFFLCGPDLLNWPPAWKMHNQAAFIPSYDIANFNIMPALPFVLAAAMKLGFGTLVTPSFLLKGISLLGLLAWTWALWTLLIEWLTPNHGRSRALWAASLLALGGLWDPILRWGTFVVRTEIWIGLCWVWILRELGRWERIEAETPELAQEKWPRLAWRLAGFIALSAYIHYEAVFFVPAIIIGLGFSRGWFRRLLGIGLRTLAFLSPWLLFVFVHFGLFFEQMEIQFHRLAHVNTWMLSPYLIFHSLFLEHGSPAGSPKFFNLAKGLFWALILGLSLIFPRTLFQVIGQAFRRSAPVGSRVLLAAILAFFFTFYLWATKAEVWFITLCHVSAWCAFGAALLCLQTSWKSRIVVGFSGAYALLGLAASIGQAHDISPGYTWAQYTKWVDCIDQISQLATPLEHGGVAKIWEPNVPDVLVELSQRHPGWDLTRSLDFPNRRNLALDAAQRMDVIILSRAFNPKDAAATAQYQGRLRMPDLDRLSREEDLPFGPWALNELGRTNSPWKSVVCEVGPFWATVVFKK
ncbi:hypothetical protein WDW37_21265 [Bdellovibrionota bacterium FG-1]